MTDFAVLNIIILIFFAWSGFLSRAENAGKFTLEDRSRKVSLAYSLAIVAIIVLALIVIFLKFPSNFLLIYLKAVLSVLIFAHAWWFSANKERSMRIVLFLTAFLIILWRWISPSVISHDLFLATALVWVGPFLAQQKILTSKRLTMLGVFLFLYDILFVWLTPAAKDLNIATHSIGFPFALFVNGLSIGTGDLIWGNLVIAALEKKRSQAGLITLFIISNIALGILAYFITGITIFPLLVLWVPVGIFSLMF